jgi:hypothetical protein
MMKISDAIKELTSTYRSLAEVARALPVDATEVADALAKADPESEEFTVLQVLASLNPVVVVTNTQVESTE